LIRNVPIFDVDAHAGRMASTATARSAPQHGTCYSMRLQPREFENLAYGVEERKFAGVIVEEWGVLKSAPLEATANRDYR
jgi:hypothetical protein